MTTLAEAIEILTTTYSSLDSVAQGLQVDAKEVADALAKADSDTAEAVALAVLAKFNPYTPPVSKTKAQPITEQDSKTTIQNTNDLLSYLITQSTGGQKNWFGFQQQKLTGINLAYKIAENHANCMTPDEIVNFVTDLNNKIYIKIIKGE